MGWIQGFNVIDKFSLKLITYTFLSLNFSFFSNLLSQRQFSVMDFFTFLLPFLVFLCLAFIVDSKQDRTRDKRHFRRIEDNL